MGGTPSGGADDPERPYRKARAYAFKLLAVRDRSARELLTRLSEKHPEAIAERIVAEFTEDDYLNDARLATRLAEVLTQSRHYGPRRVRHELARRGIGADDAAAALSPLSDGDRVRDTALAASLTHLKGSVEPADERTQRRLAGYLGRRGFPDSIIRDMVYLARDGRLTEEP
ncbi:MAG: regulatory protein RecX [Leptospirillia bacterium]